MVGPEGLSNPCPFNDLGCLTAPAPTIDTIQETAALANRAALFKDELLSAALSYASRGYPLFPAEMRNGTKKPLIRIGKGAEHGKHASIDPDQIRAWWSRWPLAMIGMPTGRRSGIVVLDVDRKNGVDGLANLRAAGINPFSMTPIVAETPSSGLHFYFRAGDDRLKNSAGLLAEGVDIRGDGGIIILPPSLPTLEGTEYCWEYGDASL